MNVSARRRPKTVSSAQPFVRAVRVKRTKYGISPKRKRPTT
jgi:hypothetical protein